MQESECIDKARIQQFIKLATLVVSKARVVVIVCRIFQIDRHVRHIEIAANHERFFCVQIRNEIFEDIFPIHSIIESLEILPRVRSIDIDEEKLIEFESAEPPHG